MTEEEIKSIIEEGTEEGEVQPVEKDIMQRVFLLGDLKVSSIMTHKSDIVWLDMDMTADEVRAVVNENLFEFYPIADGDLDHVKGIVNLKDLVVHLSNPDFKLASLIHEATYFHESMNVYKVLEQMKMQKISRALVCDEFGICTGIITLRDILEGLVGNVDDPEEEPDIIKRVNKEGWLVDGQCSLYDFLCYFNRSDLFEASEYHTLGGLLLKELQHIPTSGETLQWNGFTFEVVDMDGARKNVEAEIPGWDFDGVRSAARQAWNDYLSENRYPYAECRPAHDVLYSPFITPVCSPISLRMQTDVISVWI